MTTISRSSRRVGPGERTRQPQLALAATASFVVTVSVLFVPHEGIPDNASAREVTAFFTDNYAVQQSQALMHSLGAVALLAFLSHLAALVRRFEGPDGVAARVVNAAGAAFTAIVLVTMGLVSATIYLTGSADGATQETLYSIGWDLHFKVAYLVPLILLPACLVLRRAKAAPAFLTWSGLGLGALALVSTLGNLSRDTMFVQYPVFMLFLLWTLVAGLVMGLRGVPGGVTAAPGSGRAE